MISTKSNWTKVKGVSQTKPLILILGLFISAFSIHFTYGQTSNSLIDKKCNLKDLSLQDANELIDNLLDKVGLFSNFEIGECEFLDFPEAVESLQLDSGRHYRYLLYNKQWMEDLINQLEEDHDEAWVGLGLLMHEIGHHLYGHSLLDGTNHRMELEADQFTGFALSQLGATLEQAQSSLRNAAENETAVYPSKRNRLNSVEVGWAKYRSSSILQESESSISNNDYSSATMESSQLLTKLYRIDRDLARDIELLSSSTELKPTEIQLLKSTLKSVLGKNRGSKVLLAERVLDSVFSKFSYKAVVIGNSKYEFLEPLSNPTNDAKTLIDLLVTDYMFDGEDITRLENATRKEIIHSLDSLMKESKPNEMLLVFYAGHGVYDQDLKKGFWLPIDAKMDDKSTWVSNSVILDFLSATKAQHILLINDSCYSGSMFMYNRSSESTRGQKELSERLISKKSRIGISSGDLRPVPDESQFFKYFINELRDNNKKYIRALEVALEISEAVAANTKNLPQYGALKNTGHGGGEFVFLKRK